jgi:Methylamine utilisation protein MauE
LRGYLAAMIVAAAWMAIALALLTAAALKAADRNGTAVALAGYGVPGRFAAPAWALLVAAEGALAAGIAAGLDGAAYAAAGLLCAFLLAQVVALAQGGAGAPCGCFGAGGRLSRAAAGRTALIASACALLPALGAGPGLPLVPAAALAAAAIVLAAGRGTAPAGALEIAGEGPPLGEAGPLAALFEGGDEPVRIALFTSPGCGLCRQVAPAAVQLGLPVRRFDEVADADAWAAARVPGAPYAVALAPDGVALAKGTVNDARQLASVVAAARERSAGGSRRAFLGRAGALAAGAAGAGVVGAVVRPGSADAYHFCGHIYTTDGCPHPTGLPRIDRRGLPLRARDGRRVDDLGRLIDCSGAPVDEDGIRLADMEGRPLPRAPRTAVCALTGATRGFKDHIDGAWYRCCDGRVRKLVDCCARTHDRINGDAALRGYCYDKRKVYCVMYFQSKVPC